MDILALSRKHLEDAVELGYITVNGKELPLTAPQILAIAKSIVKDSIVSVSETEDTAPSELFRPPRHDIEENLVELDRDLRESDY